MSASKTSSAASAWRALVFPGGTEIGLEIRKALGTCKEVSLISAGSAGSSHAPFVFERHFEIPAVSEPGCLEQLVALVEREGITHVFPAHDDVVLFLAENAGRIPAKIVTSSLAVCRIARSKTDTLRALRDVVPTPAVYDAMEQVATYPVFLKPDRGQGSQGVAVARDRDELAALLTLDPSRLIQEFLEGPEYTVDCFSDRERGLLYARGRSRDRIRSGIAMHSVFVDDPRFEEYARLVHGVLPFSGAWFYQAKADSSGCLKLTEIAPRIAGTSALSRAAGVNLPLLSLYEAERVPVRIVPSPQRIALDRALANRCRVEADFRTLYVDLDDTLLVRGGVNAELMQLIYQSLNRGVRLVLLTRHAADLDRTLDRWRLSGVFDEIVHLRNGESKATAIGEGSALLIDDSFAEREAVRRETGIAVADPSMVEAFLEDRR